jgi:hypothetical protein
MSFALCVMLSFLLSLPFLSLVLFFPPFLFSSYPFEVQKGSVGMVWSKVYAYLIDVLCANGEDPAPMHLQSSILVSSILSCFLCGCEQLL